ncbi:MAG: hypothetical protein HUU55_19620 [Myxococcales bacterium]|nr:hypothetical protein [Myxococcales bacterium]
MKVLSQFVTKKGRLLRCCLPAMLLAGFAACAGAKDDPCQVDSDCEPGLWCHPTAQVCSAVTCEGTQCEVPGDPDTSDIDSDATEDGALTDAGEIDVSTDVSTTENDVSVAVDSSETDTANCSTPTSWSYRITGLTIGDAGTPGKGLNIDDNPATCAPSTGCSDGVDNGFAGVSGLAAEALAQAVNTETIRLMLRRQGCGPVELLTYTKNGSTRRIDTESIDAETGYGKSYVPNVVVDNPTFSAGPDGEFAFPLAVAGAQTIVPIHQVHISGTIRGDNITVVLGGIVDKNELDTSLAELAKGMGLEPKTVFDLVGGLTEIDQDTNNDGTQDAISIGLILAGIWEEI